MLRQSKINNIYLQIIKVGIFIILFLPLFVNHNFLFPFVFPRTIAFRLIIEICLLLYLAISIIDSRFRPKWSIMLTLITGFLGLLTISSLLGANFYHSFFSSVERSEGINTWLHFLAFFIVLIGIFKTKQDWIGLFKVAVIAGWIQTIYALGQFFKLSYMLRGAGERITGSLGNPSFLATYLIFIIFIAAYLYCQTKSFWHKLSYALLIVLNIFILWHTQTRGAILAFIFGLLFFIGLKFWRTKSPKLKITFIVAVLILFIVSIFLIANKNSSWISSSCTINRLASISLTDVSTQNRLIVWQVGWQGFKQHPWLGWGWENFNITFNKYFNPMLTRDIGSHPWYDRAHNIIVEIAVTAGIFGLLMYLAIIGFAARLAWKNQKNGQFSTTVSLLFITLFLIHFLQNLFVFDTLNSYLMLFLILAFIQSQQNYPGELPKQKNVTPKIKIIPVSLLLLIIIAPLIYFLNIKPVLANYQIIQAITKSKTSPAGMLASFKKSFKYSPPDDQELRFILIQHTRDQINLRGINSETIPLIQFTIEETQKSIAASPDYIQNYLLLAELYLATAPINPKYIQSARAITLKALEKAPKRYQVYTLLGRLAVAQKQFDKGIEYFQQAIELNDKFAETHWNLAIAYILSWQPELAQQSLDQALELGFNVYQEKNINLLFLAYSDSKNLNATINFVESLIQRFPQNIQYQQSLESLQKIQQQMTDNSL